MCDLIQICTYWAIAGCTASSCVSHLMHDVWADQCRNHHQESSGAQTYWILGATGCAYAHLKQDCSESGVEGFKIVGQLYHDRLELGLCTVCCQNAESRCVMPG